MGTVLSLLREVPFVVLPHGNAFAKKQWDCRSLFHGQSRPFYTLIHVSVSLSVLFAADELSPYSRNSF